ncbi:serine/threonine-protein kinase [Nonomuraea lactucae]|uniref:serine/threonine-protein kinase n=1 Tax=Nonomuraea lactucae TaxID=2249762 RepID=UPI000DE50EB6|nr:serine/threonine-protein kinase [Nonomuraea lactucae]
MPEHQTRLLAERYELISPLGRGTMGTVWRAHDRALGREVAVKQIRQDPGLTEEQRAELRERMVREGRIAARISHPAVAAIHDVLIHDNSPWIIMELVEARSLEQVIDEEGPLPARLVAEIGVDLLGALRAAHAQGITHRDVKPGNVLITETGRVVLTDFGIARAEGDSRLTRTGMVIGSPGYTAPERARGEYTGPESDIWSLGATLYFAVEGRPAYERATIAETLAALLSEDTDPPTQAGQLRPVLHGLLAKDYKQRLSAAQAETMLRMVADTPTSEMPAITAEAAASPPHSVPAPHAQPSPHGHFSPHGQPGAPGQPAPHPQPSPHPQPAPRVRPGPQSLAARGPGTVPHAKAGPASGAPGASSGASRASSGVSGAPAQAQQHPRSEQPPYEPSQADPYEPSPGDRFDPDRTVSVMRPKAPMPQDGPPSGAQGHPPQSPPPDPHDEGSFATRRVQVPRPQSGSPGQQVYPLPAPQPGGAQPFAQPPQGMPQPPYATHPAGPQVGPPYGMGQPPPERPDSGGLGTDLFAIAGPEQRPAGDRTGMLILMGVAAAAAVVIAILIVAVLSA